MMIEVLWDRGKFWPCAQDYNMHSFHFDDQYNTFHSYSYAVAPGGQGVVGDEEAFAEKKGSAPSSTSHAI